MTIQDRNEPDGGYILGFASRLDVMTYGSRSDRGGGFFVHRLSLEGASPYHVTTESPPYFSVTIRWSAVTASYFKLSRSG